ncbi:site-2 protease family protein [Sorangium sp. So ce887]|uniref:site-2 protease family protein n=1 Tax=Sorangium sp. So ce887 TaxID=3133324 RepID=UPI003F646F93
MTGGKSSSSAAAFPLLSPDIEVVGPAEGEGPDPRRFALYDRATDTSFALGKAELTLARLFDGRRSRDEVLEQARACVSPRLSAEKLAQFEQRLVGLGILVDSSRPERARKDPFAGISFGPLKSLLLVPLINLKPDEHLDRLARAAPVLVSRWLVYGCLALIAAGGWIAGLRWHVFSGDLVLAYTGWGWLPWHYPIMIASVVCHELGHALPCKAYGVRISEMGLGAYLLFVTGWARPVQREWSRMTKRQRVVSIVMGPLASLACASVGMVIWALAAPGSELGVFGVRVAATSALAVIPTLLPVFNGDSYLFLTEVLGIPGLRQKSWRFARGLLRRDTGRTQDLSARRKLLYLSVVAGTFLSWLIAWASAYSLFFR